MRSLLATLLLPLAALALDPYQPLEEGGVQADLDLAYQSYRGDYNADGGVETIDGNPFAVRPSLQVKFGLADYTEMSFRLPMGFVSEDALDSGWALGFSQPDLSFKITREDWARWGARGGFVGSILFPIGTKDVNGEKLRWGFLVGGFGNWTRGGFSTDAMASWTFIPSESDGIRPGDLFRVLARPAWTFGNGIRPFLEVEQLWRLAETTKGKTTGWFSDLTTLQPGLSAPLGEEFRLDVGAPVTVRGSDPQKAVTAVKLSLQAYFDP